MIIGICGMKGSGKDTVGAYLIKEHEFERRSFAEPLKRSVAALLGIPLSDLEKYKNDPKVCVEVVEYATEIKRNNDDYKFLFVNHGITFREFLQRYGTESHRDIFGDNFWVDLALPVEGFYSGRAIVVTDVRFANEAARIKELNGYLWQVVRPGLDSQDPHSSEVIDFEVDTMINNDSTISNLYAAVEEAIGLERSVW